MTNQQIDILKIGGSVLLSAAHVPLAVSEIYRSVRQGRKVIAVVSALKGETDKLSKLAKDYNGETSKHLPFLLATGELSSAAILALALEQAGLDACIRQPQDISLTACGHALDADLKSVDAEALQQACAVHDVVIVPGFYAATPQGGLCLLGRGGTDFTAVFLGTVLPHARVRLLKDVDGVYEHDPKQLKAPPRRYIAVSWDDIQIHAASLVQLKTSAFAKTHRRKFEVAAFGENFFTEVGPQTRLAERHEKRRRLRIALLGHGVVGGGVAARLELEPERYEIVSILVRDLARHKAAFPLRPFTDSNDVFLQVQADVVIDCGSSADHSAATLHAFLRRRVCAITANKQALATKLDVLQAVSVLHNAPLLFSATVGGGVPCLELADRAKEYGSSPVMIEAILNGTTNFILGCLEKGDDFQSALARAQEKGLAEADPSADIDGADAAAKIYLLAARVFQGPLPALETIACESWRTATARIASQRKCFKQIARAELKNGSVSLKVSFEERDSADWLAGAQGEENRIRIVTASGEEFRAAGKGAGRIPTVAAVMADLIDLRNILVSKPSLSAIEDKKQVKAQVSPVLTAAAGL